MTHVSVTRLWTGFRYFRDKKSSARLTLICNTVLIFPFFWNSLLDHQRRLKIPAGDVTRVTWLRLANERFANALSVGICIWLCVSVTVTTSTFMAISKLKDFPYRLSQWQLIKEQINKQHTYTKVTGFMLEGIHIIIENVIYCPSRTCVNKSLFF